MSLRLRPFAVSLLLGCMLSATAVAQDTASLRQRMTPQEFQAAGLDRLSSAQLQYLDDWLAGHAKVTTRIVDESGKPAFYVDTKREKIHAHIKGSFVGWGGATEFALDNGQVWQQAESGSYSCPTEQNPAVLIKPMLLGSWLLYAEGCDESVRVKRIR